MTGGKSGSPDKFSGNIFSFRRITLAPIVVLQDLFRNMGHYEKRPKE